MKHVSLLITFLIIVSINANGRENPFEPTQTYEAEVARLVEIDEDYPYEFQEKEDQELSKKSMKKADEKVSVKKDEIPMQAEKSVVKQEMKSKPSIQQMVKEENKETIKTEEKIPLVVKETIEKAITVIEKEDNNTNIIPTQEVKEVVMGDQAIKKEKIITLEKAMKQLKEEEIIVDVPKREDIEIHENIDILPFINVDYTNDTIEIKSKYEVFRKFTIEETNKIVLDYHAKTHFLTKSKTMDTDYFDKLVVGNHLKERYFRIVIILKHKPNKYKVTYLDNLVSIVFDKDMI